MPDQKWLFQACLLLSGFAIAVIIYMFSSHMGEGSLDMSGLFTALQPVGVGIMMTYLFYPVAYHSELYLLGKNIHVKVARLVSVIFAAICLVGLFVLFGYMILPELIDTITTLSGNLNVMLQSFISSSSVIIEDLGLPADVVQEQWNKASNTLINWVQNDLLSTISSITSGIMGIAQIAINFFIGVFIMIYMLLSREQFIGQGKKLLYAVCPNRHACTVILRCGRQINQIFGGFFTGKVIDSIIIGVITYVSLSILNIPYTMLISVIVGCTNIIPVFGPFIGAIPSGFLLLLTDPTKCLVFVIFILVLQQVDGNIIGPMILGDSTGLPAFWVLFSLLLFQYLLGFWGMIVGVPIFATIYYLARELVNYFLTKRELPTKTTDYVNIKSIEDDGTPIYIEEGKRSSFLKIFQRFKKTK